MSTSPALIRLERVRATLAGHRALDRVDWEFLPGTHWAVAGTNGSGKTTFLRIVRGDLWPDQKQGGRRVYNFHGKEQLTPIGLRQSIGYVSAELQDRYLRHEWDIPIETAVLTGFYDTPLLYAKPEPGQIERCHELLERLGITHLREKRMLSLSQGEARKVLIARAMAPLTARPSLLLLDEVCEGLDQGSRRDLLDAVDSLAASGVHILFATHRPDEIPQCLNHGLVFQDGVIVSQGPLATVDFSACRAPDTPPAERPLPESSRSATTGAAQGPVVEVRRADVFLQGKSILKDINWRIEPGEQWAVLGSNGAGKSTLLKLLRGEIHPALGGEVYRFGRLPGVELRLVRRHLGHVSSGFQAEYAAQWGRALSAGELVLSGFFDSIGLYDGATPDQERIAREWMEFWGVDSLAKRKLDELSYGQLRRLLLARALAPGPDLLLLDEPCAGLDPASRDGLLATLSRLVRGGQQIVHVTHYPEELIKETTHVLELDHGRMAFCGPKQSHPLFPGEA